MNYIKLINAFYDRLETNSLSTSAIALWHALVHVNNKAGWQREFTVAVSVLCVKTGLSERTISNARNDLKMKGFLDFKSRKGNKSAVYILNDLSAIDAGKLSEKKSVQEIDADNLSDNASDNLSGNVSDNASALIKRNETKQNETYSAAADTNNRRENYFNSYMLCFGGQPSSLQRDEINSFIDQDGLDEEVVCIAFRKAAEVGAKYPYARSILNRWVKAGIKTATDVEREQEAFEQKKQNRPKRQGRVERLPSWYGDDQNEQSNVVPINQNEAESVEEKRKRLEAIRQQYKKA